jgi:hypothetical protein
MDKSLLEYNVNEYKSNIRHSLCTVTLHVHKVNTVLAYDVTEYTYRGQCYVFLTKQDLCVYSLMMAMHINRNMWNNFI